MYCKKCGQQIDDSATFCEHCGADQRPAPEAPAYQPQPQPTAWEPNGYSAPVGAEPVKGTSYLVWSILVTIFCCLPLGIPAIVYAAKIDSCNARGDFYAAAEAARKAKSFCIWGAVLTVVFAILYFVFFALVGLDSGLFW